LPKTSFIRATPENVGPVAPGDVMTAHIDGLHDINVKVI
jgi:2-keto-4-pentenoate hydratase/2-oxohepta-3-ene-1,7-dioic acid hydratase in catechol pathway